MVRSAFAFMVLGSFLPIVIARLDRAIHVYAGPSIS
jgi:hypothetical protein